MPKPSAVEQALREDGKQPGAGLVQMVDDLARVDAQAEMDLGPCVVAQAKGKNEPFSQSPIGKGRPRGARNRATKETNELLAKLGHKDPLVAAREWITAGPVELAKVLECSKSVAFDKYMALINFATPYTHAKQPTAVNVQGLPEVPVLIGIGVGGAQQSAVNSETSPFGHLEVAQLEGRTNDPTG